MDEMGSELDLCYSFQDEEAGYGELIVPEVGKACVDTGANFSAWVSTAKRYMRNRRKVNTVIGDYKGNFTKSEVDQGNLHLNVYGENGESGVIAIEAKALDDMGESLLSVSQMCEMLGFSLLIRPVKEGDSYFYKGDERLPIQYCQRRRLYFLSYAFADSAEGAKDAASRYQFLRQGDEISQEMRLMSSVSAADVDCLENLAVYMQQHGGEAYVIEGGREVGVLELAEARQAYNLRSNDAGYTKGSDKPAVSVTPKAADLSEVDNDDEEQKRPADTTANADLDHAGQDEAERLIGDKLVVHEGQTSAGFIDYNNDGDNDHDAMKADDHDMDDVFHEMESVPSSSFRPGLRKLSKKEMHEKLLHTGESHDCQICAGLRAGRPHRKIFRRVKDPVAGRTVSMDAIIWKQRGKHGEKATVGIIDDKSNYIWHFEMVKRSDATQSFIDTVLAARADPEFGRPDLISIVRTDNAGEWGRDNADFHRRVKEGLAPHVPKFEYLGTMIDSRYNAMGEVCMRIIEEMTKAVMLMTRLEIELRPLATEYAVRMHNLTLKRKRANADGSGVRPLQELSGFKIGAETCDQRIDEGVEPGALILMKIKHVKGSNNADLRRWKWGRALRMNGKLIECECPLTGNRFAGVDGIRVKMPPGMSPYGYLNQEMPDIPQAALPHPGDEEYEKTRTVIRLDDLGLHDDDALRNPVASLEELGKTPTPGFVVINGDGQVCEPDGPDQYLHPTSTKAVFVGSDEPAALQGRRQRLIDYLTYVPTYFVGQHVWRRWEGDDKVYRGKVTSTEKLKVNGTDSDVQHWRIEWENSAYDDDCEDFDAEDMQQFCIDRIDGTQIGAGGSVLDSGDGQRVDAVGPGDGADVIEENQPQIEDAHDGDGKEESEPIPEAEISDWITTNKGDTWIDIIETIDKSPSITTGDEDETPFSDVDMQEAYYEWLLRDFNLGSDKKFDEMLGGCWFPNPIRKQTTKKMRRKSWYKLPAGVRFPMPCGKRWDEYLQSRQQSQDRTDKGENADANAYLTELAAMEVMTEVWIDSAVIKSLQSEEDIAENMIQQIEMHELAEGEDLDVLYASVEDAQYYDENGMPKAPTSVKALMKRKACRKIWLDAIEKEHKQLDDRGVFEYMTMSEAWKRGFITDKKKPIPMRLLLSTKVKPDGSYDRVKARSVLSGDRMVKGLHYSVVFTASPTLTAGRILQGLTVKENLARFAGDVKQAFTIAESQPQEQIAVRMAEGMKRYDANGVELIAVLRRNIYGSPLASRNWAIHRNDWMLNRMGKSEGWIVKQMLYEPCLFTVLIPDDPAEAKETEEKKKNAESDESGYRKSYLLIHTDDIDGAAEDPRDGDAILNAFDKEFGITLCESRFMLGVQREITVNSDGVIMNKLTQVAFIEDAWEEWGHFRKGKSAPKRPADGLKFTDDNGALKIVEKEEYEKVTQRGYRSLVGTILWPARNAYPIISYACTQLCRAMEKPSEEAWESALYCLHYLYSIREAGITFRSDGNEIPVCYYDSGHLQDRVDYKSFYGLVIVWMGGCILWVSKKHQHVGESSAEDEYMALNHAYKRVMWLRLLFKELGFDDLIEMPTLLLGDNKQAGRWSRDDMITNGNRFIERMYFKVREGVLAGDVETRYINTKQNPSDLFTKDVPREVVEVLGPMLTGEAAWPDTPESEDALKAQIADMRLCV
jgi:hypothetical protein